MLRNFILFLKDLEADDVYFVLVLEFLKLLTLLPRYDKALHHPSRVHACNYDRERHQVEGDHEVEADEKCTICQARYVLNLTVRRRPVVEPTL